MKIELDLPDEIVRDLRKRGNGRGLSLGDYAMQLVRETLSKPIENTPEQHRAIDARLNEGLDDLKRGRIHGPFSRHPELMSNLRGKPKKSRVSEP